MNNHLQFRFRSNLSIVTNDEPILPYADTSPMLEDPDDDSAAGEAVDDASATAEAAATHDSSAGIELELHDLSASDEYFKRLASIARRTDHMASTLVAHFGQSYLFHDHVISRLELSPDGKSLTLEITGCTVDNAKGQMTDEGDDLRFTFKFHDVVYFANDIFHQFENAWIIDRSVAGRRWFQYSEVDTLDELIQKATARYAKTPGFLFEHIKEDFGITDFHSLLIQHGSPDGMIGIVFRGIDVNVSEPLAWRMLQRDPAFSVPLLTAEQLQTMVADVGHASRED